MKKTTLLYAFYLVRIISILYTSSLLCPVPILKNILFNAICFMSIIIITYSTFGKYYKKIKTFLFI